MGFENNEFTYIYNLERTTTINFTISKEPVGIGSINECRYIYVDSEGKYVGKIPRKYDLNVEDLKNDIESSVMSMQLAIIFNKAIGRKMIEGTKLVIFEILKKSECLLNIKTLLAQRYLEGDFVKYNNNFGWTNLTGKPEFNNIAQAFSHFTFEYTKGTLIMVDIQGVVDKKNILKITDPAIHSELYRKKFGITNFGQFGIVKFFRTHKCNDLCRKLGLIDPKSPDVIEYVKKSPGDTALVKKIQYLYEKEIIAFIKDFNKTELQIEEIIVPKLQTSTFIIGDPKQSMSNVYAIPAESNGHSTYMGEPS